MKTNTPFIILLSLFTLISSFVGCGQLGPSLKEEFQGKSSALRAAGQKIGTALESIPISEIETSPMLFKAIQIKGQISGIANQIDKYINLLDKKNASTLTITEVFGGGINLQELDVPMLAMLIMFEAAKDARQDTRDLLEEMQRNTEGKAQQREIEQGLKEAEEKFNELMNASITALVIGITSASISIPTASSSSDITLSPARPTRIIPIPHLSKGHFSFDLSCIFPTQSGEVEVSLENTISGEVIVSTKLNTNKNLYQFPAQEVASGAYKIVLKSLGQKIICGLVSKSNAVAGSKTTPFTVEQIKYHSALKSQLHTQLNEGLTTIDNFVSKKEINPRIAVLLQKQLLKTSDIAAPNPSPDALAEEVDRLKEELSTANEMSEMGMLHLQEYMSRMSKSMQAAANLLKKSQETSDSIASNLR